MSTVSPLEAWRKCWRDGVAPGLSVGALQALAHALERDDKALVQGATTAPPPLHVCEDWPCEAACAVAYAGWQGEGLETVGEVEAFFARVCHETDERLGEPAGCRWLLNWYDDTPRDVMRRELLAEVLRATNERRGEPAGLPAA